MAVMGSPVFWGQKANLPSLYKMVADVIGKAHDGLQLKDVIHLVCQLIIVN